MNTTWLTAFTRDDVGENHITRHPWRVDRDGLRYSIATDGHVMIVLQDAESPFPLLADAAEPTWASALALAFDVTKKGKPLALADLRRFVDAQTITLDGREACVHCSDSGWIECTTCSGEGYCSCPVCSDSHNCSTCDGDGGDGCGCGMPLIRPKKMRPVWLFDVPVNALLIAGPLAHLPGDEATISRAELHKAEHGPIFIDGPGWRLVAMGIKPTDDQLKVMPRFPAPR